MSTTTNPTTGTVPLMASQHRSTISTAIREARTRQGLTQVELADKLGLSDATNVSRWERGVATPRSTTLEKIADALGVTSVQLLTGNLKTDATIVSSPPPASLSEKLDEVIALLHALQGSIDTGTHDFNARIESVENKLVLGLFGKTKLEF